jgi:hypothetical protein
LWGYTVAGDQVVLGVQTTIDTSAGGFTDAPCYFAWLQGPVFNPQTRQLAQVLLPSIAEETVNSFVFRIAFPLPSAGFFSAHVAPTINYVTPEQFSSFAHQQNLYVNWVGCQKNASAPVIASLLSNPGLLLGLNLLRFSTLSLNLNLFATVLNKLNKL